MGSVLLRSIQVSQMLNSIAGINSKVISTKELFNSSIQDSIIVFSKSAIRTSSPIQLADLGNRGNRLISDQLDRDLADSSGNFHHAIVADETHFSYDRAGTTLIPHAPDWRLTTSKSILNINRKDKIQIAYAGSPELYLFKGINAPNIKTFFTRLYQFQTASNPGKLSRINRFPLHLSVAPHEYSRSPRPITKIVNSLKVGALPIIGKWEKNAVKLLGEDYPLTLKSNNLVNQLIEVNEFQNCDRDSLMKSILRNQELESHLCPYWHSALWLSMLESLEE